MQHYLDDKKSIQCNDLTKKKIEIEDNGIPETPTPFELANIGNEDANVSKVMESLACWYKISLILSKKLMGFKKIAVFCELTQRQLLQIGDF